MKRTDALEPRASGAAVPSGPLIALFYLLSFLSGVAALTYEITWARMLALSLGSTTLSAGAVVAGFMGGMGLGAWLFHRVLERGARPLLLYGLLEIGIALTTAALTAGLYALPRGLALLARTVGSGPPATLVGLLLAMGLVALPAILIGATFPALCAVLIRSAHGVDRHLGLIYGVNTVGAAAGALLAGLFLMERFGLQRSVTIANGLNVAVGFAALLLLRTALGHAGGPARRAETGIPTRLPFRLTGAVLLLSGFSTLAYEIIWFRALRYLFGHSTYALIMVLVIFLLGLGLGALLLPAALRRVKAETALAGCQFGIALFGLLAMAAAWFLARDPDLRGRTHSIRSESRNRSAMRADESTSGGHVTWGSTFDAIAWRRLPSLDISELTQAFELFGRRSDASPRCHLATNRPFQLPLHEGGELGRRLVHVLSLPGVQPQIIEP
jgi:MFS family permease